MSDEELDAVNEMREMLEICRDAFRAANVNLLVDQINDTLESAKVFDLENDL